jgi:hypothetical protein
MLKQLNDFPKARLWYYAWIAVAILYAIPIAMRAYDRIIDVTRKAREQLIVQHRLWELHPEYRGTPEAWTRFASRLLTDGQLMVRMRAKYGERAEQIELEYRSDLTIAQAEVVVGAAAIWGAPVAVLYGIGMVAARRRRPPPPLAPERPRYDESRYRP